MSESLRDYIVKVYCYFAISLLPLSSLSSGGWGKGGAKVGGGGGGGGRGGKLVYV